MTAELPARTPRRSRIGLTILVLALLGGAGSLYWAFAQSNSEYDALVHGPMPDAALHLEPGVQKVYVEGRYWDGVKACDCEEVFESTVTVDGPDGPLEVTEPDVHDQYGDRGSPVGTEIVDVDIPEAGEYHVHAEGPVGDTIAVGDYDLHAGLTPALLAIGCFVVAFGAVMLRPWRRR